MRPIRSLVAGFLILACLSPAGCTAEQRLKASYDAATTTYNTVFDARDERVITQADVDRIVRPVRVDTDREFKQAGTFLAADKIAEMDLTLAYIAKRLLDLRPLLNEIINRRLGRQNASQAWTPSPKPSTQLPP